MVNSAGRCPVFAQSLYTQVVIRGRLDRLHLGDLLQWLQMGGLTGRLTLSERGRERRLDFLDGRIVYASSLVPGERLATWLTRTTRIPAQQVRQVLGRSMLRRTFFTDLLLDEGILDEEVLCSRIALLAEAIVRRVLLGGGADFHLDTTYPIRELLRLDVDIDPHALVMEAARQSDESARDPVPDDDLSLPYSGEAFERFFWEVIRQGVSSADPIHGEQAATLHDLLRNIMQTLSDWLAKSPGLVPMPSQQVSGLAAELSSGREVSLASRPHAAWNQMVFACAVADSARSPHGGLSALAEAAREIDLWDEIVTCKDWHRPNAGRLDDFTRDSVTAWTRASCAAAPTLEVDCDLVSLAVLLGAVPTDLVLWVLATLPVPHPGVRRALLGELPRRVGAQLADLAGFPSLHRQLIQGPQPSRLALCVDLGRRVLSSASVWPATAPADLVDSGEIADPGLIAQAIAAARKAIEQPLLSEALA
jgi:hypothetical protein